MRWTPRPTTLLPGAASLAAWAYLIAGRGRFWRSGPVLSAGPAATPPVAVVVPARDEAEHLEAALRSLLDQRYGGTLCVLLVDDNSTDGTGALAARLAQADPRLHVVQGSALPAGWSGKLWAVEQGLQQPAAQQAGYVLLTDADIVHGPGHLATLVGVAEREGLDLLSEMVRLRTASFAERTLIPAFVFFFQMLYPFALVNDPRRPEAAAAGGTMLVAGHALRRIGGMHSLRDALIDDVALARAVKRGGHRIWLGHATEAWSQRAYPTFRDVGAMVARTAYVQLRLSPLLLVGTVLGTGLLYLVPVAGAIGARGFGRALGALSWGLMACAFQPTLRRYRRSAWWGLALPAIALFYTGATVASAAAHYAGRGARWKGRSYRRSERRGAAGVTAPHAEPAR